MPGRDVIREFLRQSPTPAKPAKPGALSAGSAKAAAALLQKTASAIVAKAPAVVAKVNAPAIAKVNAEPGTVEAVFQGAVRQVPSRGSHASLADAFDAAKAQKETGVYGTPINPPEKATRGLRW